jgi:DNA-binding transcriptional LysR family regulator
MRVNDGTQAQGWIGVELRHFLALEAVACEASFNRAAAKLGYTPSAISQQIAALERMVGQKLIERPTGSQPMRLTRAGEVLIEHAHAIGVRLANAQADLQSLTARELDPLRVGFPGRGLGALMPGIYRRLHEERPEFTVRVLPARGEDDLVATLSRGEADVALVERPPPRRHELEHMALLEDDYVLVVARGTADLTASPSLRDLAAMPLIAFNGGKACRLTEYFKAHNLEPIWAIGSDDVQTIYAAVTLGLGPALLPRLATFSFARDVEIVELGCGLPPRRIGVAWSTARAQSASADAFVRAAVAEAGRIASGRLAVAS